jgi:hypothetical protein
MIANSSVFLIFLLQFCNSEALEDYFTMRTAQTLNSPCYQPIRPTSGLPWGNRTHIFGKSFGLAQLEFADEQIVVRNFISPLGA